MLLAGRVVDLGQRVFAVWQWWQRCSSALAPPVQHAERAAHEHCQQHSCGRSNASNHSPPLLPLLLLIARLCGIAEVSRHGIRPVTGRSTIVCAAVGAVNHLQALQRPQICLMAAVAQPAVQLTRTWIKAAVGCSQAAGVAAIEFLWGGRKCGAV